MMKEKVTYYNGIFTHIVYKPRWKWFKPPLWWCFKWAYVVTEERKIKAVMPMTMEELEELKIKQLKIKQVQKGGNDSNQTQIGIVNNFTHSEDIKENKMEESNKC